jgi:hypothetical protein
MNKSHRHRLVFSLLALLAASPTFALERPLAGALPVGHASCHARVLDATERADANRRIVSMALDRTAGDVATERKWGKLEEFDGTPLVSATLRLRLRGDPATHAVKLECARTIPDGALVCTTPGCAGGELQILADGLSGVAISIGGKLKGGRFVPHYIHLDNSCEGRSGGPLVLEQAEGERSFSLAPAPKEACR